jgi:hypothetical protein
MSLHIGKFSFVAALPLTMLLTYGAPGPQAGLQQRPERTRLAQAPRPDIQPRVAWNAGRAPSTHRASTETAHAIFLHHTNATNDYACSQVPRMLRTLQKHHTRGNGWDDVGYHFLVDRCGTIYEGRSGSLKGQVRGAHTKGFNTNTLGIAAIGNFDRARASKPMLRAIASLIAWKLRPGIDPRSTTRLKSRSSQSHYPKGSWVKFHVISAHRDAYATNCPGKDLFKQLPRLRQEVYRLRESAPERQDTAQGHAGR